jgi:hypothetical protein
MTEEIPEVSAVTEMVTVVVAAVVSEAATAAPGK